MIETKRLSNGPKFHLFGFHDLNITNSEGDKYLSLEVNVINRPPLLDKLFGLGYLRSGEFVELGNTTALNYLQGARQQWIPNSLLFAVNNKAEKVWGADISDAKDGSFLVMFR